MAKQKKTTVNIDTAVDITKNTAKATLTSSVEAIEVSEKYIQNIYNAGYDANIDALKVAKGYWEAGVEIREDWVKLFEKTGESVIDNVADMKIPTTKDAMDFGSDVFSNVTKTFQNLIPQAK